jgi:hypothetical protein
LPQGYNGLDLPLGLGADRHRSLVNIRVAQGQAYGRSHGLNM